MPPSIVVKENSSLTGFASVAKIQFFPQRKINIFRIFWVFWTIGILKGRKPNAVLMPESCA
jgi:hypothetical protein